MSSLGEFATVIEIYGSVGLPAGKHLDYTAYISMRQWLCALHIA